MTVAALKTCVLCLMLCMIGVLQVPGQERGTQPDAILVDEFGNLSHCDFTSRIDALLQELSQKPDHQGYILNYKSTRELPGDRDSHPREAFISSHINFRGFDAARVSIFRAGYLDNPRTQLWIVPPGGSLPKGLATLPPPRVPDKGTFLYVQQALRTEPVVITSEMGLGVYEGLEEFILESVRQRELAEQAELEKQMAEDEAEAAASELADKATHDHHETSTTDAAASAPGEEEEDVDRRSNEQKEADRFDWARVGVAQLISSRKGSTGVMIFYADDQRYDITKLKSFVKQGRDILARSGGIAASRIKIVFGGFRTSPSVEFWVVPPKGKSPAATPEERPVEEPEPVEEN